MRITIVQGAFLPVPALRGGAVEKLWFELGKQFSRQGHNVCHISRRFPGLPDKEVIEGVVHLRIRGHDTPSNTLKLKALDFLYSRKALKQLPPADILVTNTFWMPIIARNRQHEFGRLVVSVERMPKGQIRLYQQAACLRANSVAVEQAIIREAPKLKKRVQTIPNPLPYVPGGSAETVKEPVILYCGRMHPEKGIGLLIDAFSEAYNRGLVGWNLQLVGPAEVEAGGGGLRWMENLLSQPRSRGIPVEWIGPIYDQEDLQDKYQKAAIFVYPSLAENGETFGVAPLEAMACGAVPVVSCLACFRDFIKPGRNGEVFDHRSANATSLLANHIIRLACDENQRKMLSSAAREVNISHHPAQIAKLFVDCFEGLVAGPDKKHHD